MQNVIICLILIFGKTYSEINPIKAQFLMQTIEGDSPQSSMTIIMAYFPNIFEISKMSQSTFEYVIKLDSYKKEKLDVNTYRFVKGNRNEIKGIHTVQKDDRGMSFTWKSYGNKARILDLLVKDLKPYYHETEHAMNIYKFSHEGLNYTFYIQQKADYEACIIHYSLQ